MLLSARILTNVAGVNIFSYDEELRFTEGDTVDIYLQLADFTQDRSSDGYVPGGRRYVPATGATLEVTLGEIDDSRRITRFAIQPYPGDASVWRVSLLSTDSLHAGTYDLRLRLTEGAKQTTGFVRRAIAIEPSSAI